MAKIIPAIYYDGKVSKAHSVNLRLNDALTLVEYNKTYQFSQITLMPPISTKGRVLKLSDGSELHVLSELLIERHLPEGLDYKPEKLAHTIENNKKLIILSIIAVTLSVFLFLKYGTPAMASAVAEHIPSDVIEHIGKSALSQLQKTYLKPSKVSKETQKIITDKFAVFPKSNQYKLHFARAKFFGANAFALPSGDIVIFDGLIALDDKNYFGIMGILAHEMAHVKLRHGMKNIINHALVATTVSYLTGDFSTLIALFSTKIFDLQYSRQAESEADNFAIKALKQANIPSKYLATILEKLSILMLETDDAPTFLSSHPPTKKRIQIIKNSAGKLVIN